MEDTPLKVHCKYCGARQTYIHSEEKAEEDISLDDALEYDNEYICKSCGCFVRLNEALEQGVLKQLGWI